MRGADTTVPNTFASGVPEITVGRDGDSVIVLALVSYKAPSGDTSRNLRWYHAYASLLCKGFFVFICFQGALNPTHLSKNFKRKSIKNNAESSDYIVGEGFPLPPNAIKNSTSDYSPTAAAVRTSAVCAAPISHRSTLYRNRLNFRYTLPRERGFQRGEVVKKRGFKIVFKLNFIFMKSL